MKRGDATADDQAFAAAQAHADEAQEAYERVQADVSAFLKSLDQNGRVR